jgi:hypothetical protein
LDGLVREATGVADRRDRRDHGLSASDFIDSAVRTFASIEHPDDHET